MQAIHQLASRKPTREVGALRFEKYSTASAWPTRTAHRNSVEEGFAGDGSTRFEASTMEKNEQGSVTARSDRDLRFSTIPVSGSARISDE